ncbi:MAG: hypothetical protein KDI61_06645 [Alphaproteobacteria bacterium]|nr:hypothetical protein [Alphaproteobacteria bacterium]MCB1839921.1 hypothetical protein [Alphaproteobacteria bacterium]
MADDENNGGFVYFYRDEWFKHWDMTRFGEFPEGLRPPGTDNPNLTLRTYLTDGSTGACIPVYEYQGTIETWERDALSHAENTMGDPKDGTVMTLHVGRDNEYHVNEFQVPPGATLHNDHPYFQGFSYEELIAGFKEARRNAENDATVESPCDMISRDRQEPAAATEDTAFLQTRLRPGG